MYQLQNNILDYIVQESGAKPRQLGNKVLINPCPICGHRDHFFIYPESGTYSSFSGCCRGGSLVDWLCEHDGISLKEAMQRVHGELKESEEEKRKRQEAQRLARLLTEKVKSFFNACVQRYKLFYDLEAEMRCQRLELHDPVYRYVRQALRFYDRVTADFIAVDFDKQIQLMRRHQSEYFFKLKVGEASGQQ